MSANRPIFITDFSSCDYICDVNGLRIKESGHVSDQTGTNTPVPYTAPTDGGTDLKEGAIIIEVFDDAVHYWSAGCDGAAAALDLTIPRSDTDTVTSFSSEVGADAGAVDTAPVSPPAAGVTTGDTHIEKYDDFIVYWTFDGTNWVEDFRTRCGYSVGQLSNTNAGTDAPAEDCSILIWDETAGEYQNVGPADALDCTLLTA